MSEATTVAIQNMPQLVNVNEPHKKRKSKKKKHTRNNENTPNIHAANRVSNKKKRSRVGKRIELTPKMQIASSSSIDPSPMSMVFQRQTISAPKRNIVSLCGQFSRPTEVLATLRSLKYEICSPVSKETSLVVCADNDTSDKIKLAKSFGIPLITEAKLFDKPEGESDTESQELEIDLSEDEDSHILVIDESNDESLLIENTIISSGERMKDTKVAFMGKFETPFLELKQSVVREGGQITAVEALVCPPTHIVLSEEHGTPEEFIKEYSSYWWLRSAVFLSEDKLLNICDGICECPRKKPRVKRTVQQSMRRLSLEESNPNLSICSKRKQRPPTSPKKDVKPLFSFSSPDKKKGRTNEIENLNSFQFTSTQTISKSKPQKFPVRSQSQSSVSLPIITPKETPIQLPLTNITLKPSNSVPNVATIAANQFMVMNLNPPTIELPILSTKLSGKAFVLVGKFKSLKKQNLCKLIEQHSGTVPKSGHLSNKTSYLLCGTGADKTQKFKKAQEKNIQILTEEQFLLMVQSP